MYTVVVKHQNGSLISEIEIHNDYHLAPQKKLQSATLELEENTAGTFTFTVPKGQFGNGNGTDIDIKNDEVIVYQNVEVDPNKQTSRGKEIWRGFFLENNTEFFNSKTFTCIGELAYLNETIQIDKTYSYEGDNEYPEKVFTALLGIHNAKVPAKKQFQVGNVAVKADNTASHLVNRVQTDEFSTSYSDHTFDCIKKLIDSCGGYLKVRWENGTRYLDWLNTYEANGQTINFGKNLLDYTVNQDVTDLITVLYPFGESVSETVDDGQGGTTTKRVKVNIGTATDQNGRLYVTLNDTGSYSTDPMVELGWREGTVDFPNVRDSNNLKRLAINYLKNQWDADLKLYTTIQIKAVDLAYFSDEDAEPIEFLQSVKVTSTPHGIINKVVPVTKMTIPLLQPEQTIYTMSTAMRKTKQISTSVTDHDKDIEKTQDAIDATGGDGGEGEGEVVITGKDPTNDWTIGKPTVGKAPSEESGTSYLKHQKHLKVWYDMSGEVTVNPEEALVPIYEYSSSTQEWVQKERNINVAYIDGISYYESYGWTEPLGGAISKWEPTFISEDMEGIDDKSSRTYLSSTETMETDGYANVQDSFPISVYYAGPWIVPVVNPNATEDHDIVVPMNHKTLARTASLSDPQSAFWYGCQWAHYGTSDDGYQFDVRGKLRDLDDEPYSGGRGDYGKNLLPYHTPVSESGFANCRVFGSFAKGVLPMAQRPLMDGSTLCTVLYCVVNFGYGSRGSTEQPIPGISANNRGFSVFSKPNGSSGTEYERTKHGRLCWYYPGIPSMSNESIQVVALYEVDEIQDNLGEATVNPYPMMPANRWWAYAWVRNVGPGTKYTFGSDVTGGLFVATPGGAVRTGCAKWTAEFNKNRDAAIRYAHAEEFMLAGSSNPRNQCVFINGRAPGPINAPRYENPVTVTKEANEQCYGHYGFTGQAEWGSETYSSHQLSALGIRAIGYCKAAYNQITTDEVVENLKFIANKYCGN